MEEPRLRPAIYRILTDMIKLDNLISRREIEIVSETAGRFGITPQDMKLSSFMKLSEAVAIIGKSGQKTSSLVMDILEGCARSDEVCTKEEALYLYALKTCILSDRARVISVQNCVIPIQNDKIIYVSAADRIPKAIDEIRQEFDKIRDSVRLTGFEAINIPEACHRYISAGSSEALSDVLRILRPELSDEMIQENRQRLSAMSSGWFLRNVLIKKFHFPADSATEPSWMIRLADNLVDGAPFANFLLIPAEGDFENQLREITLDIARLQNSFSVSVNYSRQKSGSFDYSGFMKSILEMLALDSDTRWEVIIRTLGCKEFVGADSQTYRTALSIRMGDSEYPLIQGDRDAAFYILTLMSTAESGGLSFPRGDDAPSGVTQRRYEMIYNSLRTGMDAPIIAFYKTRNPIKSRIIKTIRENEHIGDRDLYQISESSGNLYIPLDARHIKVLRKEGGLTRSEALSESRLFRTFREIV